MHTPKINNEPNAVHTQAPQAQSGGNMPFFQPKLTVNQPGDEYEREADAVADQVMRMTDAQSLGGSQGEGNPASKPLLQRKPLALTPFFSPAAKSLQRKCAECEKEDEGVQRKETSDGTVGGQSAPSIVSDVLSSSSGQPMDGGTRQFMESRFGQDFSQVRIHVGDRAAESAEAIQARAYTSGRDVVFGKGEYQPGSDEGRKLLAHELVHVGQQGGGGGNGGYLQRMQINNTCAGHESEIQAAETEARRMTRETIATLNNVRAMMSIPPGPEAAMPSVVQLILNTFGDVGGLNTGGQGGYTVIGRLIENYERINSGFNTRTIRCDVDTVPNNDCTWRSGFVVTDNPNDIFLCPNFFSVDASSEVSDKAETLIHELAHSVLRATHQGIPERTFPPTFFDCSEPLGLDFEDAKRNAFAYGILANCLHGSQRQPQTVTASSRSGNERRREGSNTGRIAGSVIGGILGGVGGAIGGVALGNAIGASTAGIAGLGIGLGVAGAAGGAGLGYLVGSLFD